MANVSGIAPKIVNVTVILWFIRTCMYRIINGRQTEMNIRGVYRSLKMIYQINQEVKETTKFLGEPEMIKNMNNMDLAAEIMQNTSKNLDNSIQEIKRTGIFEEASDLLRVARENKSSMSEVTSALKEIQISITALRNELRYIFRK